MSVAYLYVMFTNNAIITNNFTFLYSEHYQIIKNEGYHDFEKKHEATFARWFRDHIYSNGRNAENVPKELYNLACGPDRQVRSYRGCIVNGVRFHTKNVHKLVLPRIVVLLFEVGTTRRIMSTMGS